MKILSICVASLFVALILSPATSQAALEPDTHTGFYIGLGVGVGSVQLKVANSDFESQTETSGAGQLRLGAAVSQTVLLGVESNGWTKQYQFLGGDKTTTTLNSVAATVTWYPTHYFFLKGGPALASASVEYAPATSNTTWSRSDNGGGFMIGAGGELRLTRKFALVPSAQWMWQRITTNLGFGDVDLDLSFFSITMGVGWYW